MPDWLEQPGVVLFAENYEACKRFYRDTVGLEIFTEKPALTVFRFGDGYLMLEGEGFAAPAGKSRAQNPTTLRFNVADVDVVAARLNAAGAAIKVEAFEWGTIGAFLDPDGNRCELRNHFDGFFAPKRT